MDYMDYRKQLGIDQTDDCLYMFCQRVNLFFDSHPEIPFTSKHEKEFCYHTGEKFLNLNSPMNILVQQIKQQTGLCLAWKYFEAIHNNLNKMMFALSAFYNTYDGSSDNKKIILDAIQKAAKDSHIPIEFQLLGDGQVFLFPKGVPQMDQSLIDDNIRWLSDYPLSVSAWQKALQLYAKVNVNNASEVADLFRKSLETFIKEFFQIDKSIENSKSIYGSFLKQCGVPNLLAQNFESILHNYTRFNNEYAKHNDKTQVNVLEYIMYQTGNIIRLLITLRKENPQVYQDFSLV